MKDRTFFFCNFEEQRNSSLVRTASCRSSYGYPVGIPRQEEINAAMANFTDPTISVNNLPVNPAG